MVITNFVDYFTEEVGRFGELVIRLQSNGFATDENFGVTRCLFESVSEEDFEQVVFHHFPGKASGMQITSTAFRRTLGEFVYVLYDMLEFENRSAMRARLERDGILADPTDF
jgi:hypothetical protein